MSVVTDWVGGSGEPIVCLTRGAARLIVLNRPAARNALTRQMRREFPALLAASDADPAIAAVILTGVGPAFSAGVDLRERAAQAAPPVSPNPGEVLRAARKPVIAAVNGACVTGALEMALSASFIIASSEARFADTHVKVGLKPRWGQTALLPDAIGMRRARQMMLTGAFIDAQTAFEWGLVNEVVAHAALLERCLELVAQIATGDARARAAQLDASRRTAVAALAAGMAAEQQALVEPDPPG